MPIAPVHKLKKDEIVWLGTHRCKKHKHTYLEHYSCYLKENPERNRIGFFDIEVSNLNANFGYVLCYAILDDKSGEVIGRIIDPADIRNGTFDRNIIKQLLEDFDKFDTLISYYGCLAPGRKILTADLRWVNVEDLQAGDKLLAFNENRGFNGFYKYEVAEVVHNEPIIKESSVIVLENGDEIIASNDHLWLVKRNGYWTWRRTDELMTRRGRNELQRLLPVWEDASSYHAGYLAAFLDGEGNLNQVKKRYESGIDYKNYNFNITFTQKDPSIIRKLRESLDYFGFKYSIGPYDRAHREVMRIGLLGGIHEKIRFLGIAQPAKLGRFSLRKLEHNRIIKYDSIGIVDVRPIGKHTLMGLGTTSGTYISDGFGSHNTRFDIPYVRSRAVHHGFKFPVYGAMNHVDIYYIIRNKFKLHRNSLEEATRFLLGDSNKTRIDNKIWMRATAGDAKALAYVYEHCEYDVIDTKRLYDKVIDFKKRSDRSI